MGRAALDKLIDLSNIQMLVWKGDQIGNEYTRVEPVRSDLLFLLRARTVLKLCLSDLCLPCASRRLGWLPGEG